MPSIRRASRLLRFPKEAKIIDAKIPQKVITDKYNLMVKQTADGIAKHHAAIFSNKNSKTYIRELETAAKRTISEGLLASIGPKQQQLALKIANDLVTFEAAGSDAAALAYMPKRDELCKHGIGIIAEFIASKPPEEILSNLKKMRNFLSGNLSEKEKQHMGYRQTLNNLADVFSNIGRLQTIKLYNLLGRTNFTLFEKLREQGFRNYRKSFASLIH